MNRTTLKQLSIAWTAVLLGACGDPESEQLAEEDPAEHACEHVGQAGTPIQGADTRSADAPEIAQAETPYEVALSRSAPVYVRLVGPADGLLFSNPSQIVNGLYFESSTATELPEGAPNEFCPSDVPEHFDLALEQAGNYYLELAPSAVASVWLLHTSAEGHGH
jgi:hypothetical protein